MEFYKKRFEIIGKIGNNEFSFKDRKYRTLVIPPLVETEYPIHLEEGGLAFGEIVDGVEFTCKGLEKFFLFKFNNKPVYIFDNHNHSFFFTALEQIKGQYNDLNLIHIDQHKDMRTPKFSFDDYQKNSKSDRLNLQKITMKGFNESYNNMDDILNLAYEYGNIYLNVGNYIVPLIDSGFIKEVLIVDSSYSLNKIVEHTKENYCLNIDLDFFSEDMDYIDFNLKIEKIKELMVNAKFITISTSPYFVDLNRCIIALKSLF